MSEKSISLDKIRTKEKEFLENLVVVCPDGVIAIDRNGLISIFNQAAEILTGFSAKNTIGKRNIADIYPSLETAKTIKKLIYSDAYGDPGSIVGHEIEIQTQAGQKVPIRLSASLIVKNGEEIGSIGFFHDLSQQKKMERELHRLSITDGLTQLFNQRHFYTCLSKEQERSARYQRPLSLICFDLDHFKECNDQLGHMEGDNILRIIGKLLLEVMRKSDMAFRYGGDEFFILLPETELNSAMQTGEKLRSSFNARWPYEMIYREIDLIPVTLSVGIAQLEANETMESFIKRADMAMYESKRQGGNCVTPYRSMTG